MMSGFMNTSTSGLWERWVTEIGPAIPAGLTFIAVLVLEIVLTNKRIIGFRREKKIEKAKQLGQVVTAHIDSKRVTYDYGRDGYESARYVYSIHGGRKRTKIIRFSVQGRRVTFPEAISVYYLGNQIYTDYDNPAVIPGILFLAIPFAAAITVLALTCPEMLGI